MKIAFDYQIFATQKYGGISRYIVSLTKELISQSIDAKIICPFYINKYLEELPKRYVTGSGPLNVTEANVKYLLGLNWLLSEPIKEFWAADIIHETYYSFLKVKKSKKPIVLTVHDMIHEIFINDHGFEKSFSRTIKAKKDAVCRADHVICVSESTKNDLLFFMPELDPSKVSVIYLGIENKIINPGYKSTFDLSPPFLLFVGKREGYKNFETFLRGYASSEILKKDFNLVVFGGGIFTGSEISLIKNLKLTDKQVMNIQGDDELLTFLYKNATALVYPSKYEGFGLPPLEAMANGCPVIVSNISSIPEIVSYAGEYFDPYSDESIRSSIENIVYSETKISKLKKLGMERQSHFNWKTCASKTTEIYKLLDNKF